MTDLPHSTSVNAIVETINTLAISTANEEQGNQDPTNMQLAEQLVKDLINPDLRESSLIELVKKKQMFPDLGPLLWNTFGIIALLMQEIVAMYHALSPLPVLTSAQSCRVGYVLALLQCVASHGDTRMLLLNAKILFFLHPLMDCSSNLKPYENLRLKSLYVIRALIKVPDIGVITYAHSSEIMPLCLAAMKKGNELSKLNATFIVQKILVVEANLNYACATDEHFYEVSRTLGSMMANLGNRPSPRLLKYIVGCYLELSIVPRFHDALVVILPNMIRLGTFANLLSDDSVATMWLEQLLINIQTPSVR